MKKLILALALVAGLAAGVGYVCFHAAPAHACGGLNC